MKANINNLGFTDVFRCSKENLEKNNMKVTRHCCLVLQEKEQRSEKRVLE